MEELSVAKNSTQSGTMYTRRLYSVEYTGMHRTRHPCGSMGIGLEGH